MRDMARSCTFSLTGYPTFPACLRAYNGIQCQAMPQPQQHLSGRKASASQRRPGEAFSASATDTQGFVLELALGTRLWKLPALEAPIVPYSSCLAKVLIAEGDHVLVQAVGHATGQQREKNCAECTPRGLESQNARLPGIMAPSELL